MTLPGGPAQHNHPRFDLLVDDIDAAARATVEVGGEIAHPPMEIHGHGTFAIFIRGGIHHGLWQVRI